MTNPAKRILAIIVTTLIFIVGALLTHDISIEIKDTNKPGIPSTTYDGCSDCSKSAIAIAWSMDHQSKKWSIGEDWASYFGNDMLNVNIDSDPTKISVDGDSLGYKEGDTRPSDNQLLIQRAFLRLRDTKIQSLIEN